MARVAIVGSREYKDLDAVRAFVQSLPLDAVVVSGHARGVDITAEVEATARGLALDSKPADWDNPAYRTPSGKSFAGNIRNTEILDSLNPKTDCVVAFWDGVSPGTNDTIKKAKAKGIKVEIFMPNSIHIVVAARGQIEYVRGNILNAQATAIVNPCNTVGVHGGGLSKLIAEKYPWAAADYKQMCHRGALQIGTLHVSRGNGVHSIIHFPTKRHFSFPSRLEDIETGLQAFVASYVTYQFQSVAFPKLGCGLGGLNWDDVRPVMEKYLTGLDIGVQIYE